MPCARRTVDPRGGYRRKAKFTTRTVRKIGKILGGDTGAPERNQKNPEFLHPPMAGPRGAGGMGASGPNRPRPEPADSCDNLAHLSSEPGLKWCHPVPQLEQPAPCCLAGCAGTLIVTWKMTLLVFVFLLNYGHV